MWLLLFIIKIYIKSAYFFNCRNADSCFYNNKAPKPNGMTFNEAKSLIYFTAHFCNFVL